MDEPLRDEIKFVVHRCPIHLKESGGFDPGTFTLPNAFITLP
jgi:hypothetical protein